jgi:hypothetical protein
MTLWRFLKHLFGRILTPSYISTLLWLFTDAMEVIFLGVALSVVLAVAAPLIETTTECVALWRTKRQRRRKQALLTHVVPFLNAYKDVLTTYPPGLLPAAEQWSFSAQLDIFAQHLQRLKGEKTAQYGSTYDLVSALTMHPGDFEFWHLDDCQDFMQEVLCDLSAHAVAPWHTLLERFRQQDFTGAWAASLARLGKDLANAVHQELRRSALVTLATSAPDVHERLCALLKLEAFHRQAALQTYLSSPRFHCCPHEVADTIAALRSDAVAQAFLAVLQPAEKG